MAKCFNPTCKCKDLKIVREIILRCDNCHCGVKVEETKLKGQSNMIANMFIESYENEDLLFTVLKNAK